MDESIQEKQAYLRENVLEKAYDADEFMSFLQLKKGESGLDLNNWTMYELKNAVKDFINDKDKESEKDEEINRNLSKINELDEENEINETQRQSLIKEALNNDNINIQENNILIPMPNNENELDIEKCQVSEVSPLSNINSIIVKLSSPKKIDGGIFSKSFISYVVSTEPLGYKTNKRYNDFSWLRKTLSMIYVNCVLPPLCKKNFGDRFSDALTSKRMRSIEKFMQGIIEHPLIKNSELIHIFLSAQKKDEYKKKIQKYQKIKKAPSLVKDLKTMDGIIDIGVNKEKEIYLDNIKNYAQGNYHLLQKITKSYKSMMNIMQQLTDKMKHISQLWKLVLDRSIKYYDSHNTSETFNIMSKLMDDWGNIQKKQIKIMNENIREYFRYVKNEFNSLKEMATKVKNSRIQYFKANEKLLNTKENLFQKQEVDLWQLKEEDKPHKLNLLKNKDLAFAKMLPQDIMKVRDYKNFYGCMLNSLIGEFERIRKINAKRHKENITNFVRLISTECTNLHVSLADRLSEFNELRDDADIDNIDGGIKLKKVENIVDNSNEENEKNSGFSDFENIEFIDEDGEIKYEKDNKEKNKKEENNKEESKKEDNKKEDNKKEEIKKEEVKKEDNKIEENKKEENKQKDKKEENKKK